MYSNFYNNFAGDFVAKTILGRIISVMMCVWGIINISFFGIFFSLKFLILFFDYITIQII